jgi:hypothetical protein
LRLLRPSRLPVWPVPVWLASRYVEASELWRKIVYVPSLPPPFRPSRPAPKETSQSSSFPPFRFSQLLHHLPRYRSRHPLCLEAREPAQCSHRSRLVRSSFPLRARLRRPLIRLPCPFRSLPDGYSAENGGNPPERTVMPYMQMRNKVRSRPRPQAQVLGRIDRFS